MSAAATAAGYLYASGRLRGREKRENEHEHQKEHQQHEKPDHAPEQRTARPSIQRPRIEKPVRVAAIPAREDLGAQSGERSAPRRTPTIQYRVRRWKPEQPHEE